MFYRATELISYRPAEFITDCKINKKIAMTTGSEC